MLPGAIILIPWHPNVLRKYIATMNHLGAQVAETANELREEQHANKEKLEQFLIFIDSVCMLANVGKGVAELVVHGAKHGEMTAAQLVGWFFNSRLEMASDLTTLSVPAPSEPKRDFRFFVRHTLGPWTPSYWASVYAAVKTGDVDTYLYGPAAVQYQTLRKIKQQADAELGRLRSKAEEARRQLAMPFYSVRM
jgi:hypothetical protein